MHPWAAFACRLPRRSLTPHSLARPVPPLAPIAPSRAEVVRIDSDANAADNPYAVDNWALGVMLYQMLVGERPFQAPTEYLVWQKVAAMEWEMPEDGSVPEDAADLINRLMDPNPATRAGLDEVRAHAFFSGVEWGAGLWDRGDAPERLPADESECARAAKSP